MPDLTTERLRMVPFGLVEVDAARTNRAKLARLLDVAVPASWPGPDIAEILDWKAERLRADPLRARWSGLIIHRADRRLIGDMGCKGGPDADGMVEFGYSIVPEYRGHGYAPEMAAALIAWARQQPGVRRVTAETEVDNRASARVLEKVGMRQVAERDGLLLWEYGQEPE